MATPDLTPFATRSKLLTIYADRVRAIRAGGDPYPVQMEVNVSDVCNQRCAWCISENVRGEAERLDIADPRVRAFFADFARLGGVAVGWSGGGEPTVHPQFPEALALAGEAKLAQGLITHGAFRAELIEPIARYCGWVRISVDTHDRDAYARQRGTRPESFDQVLANCRALVAAGVTVGLNINVGEWNVGHVEPLFELARSLETAYLQVRPTLPTPFPHARSDATLTADGLAALRTTLAKLEARARSGPTRLLVSQDKFADFLKPDGGRDDPRTGYTGCMSHRIFVVLNSNGDLAVCMYHLFDERFVLGNILEDSLEAIWVSGRRRAVRAFCEVRSTPALHHRLHGCQICCKGHEINKVLAHPPDDAPAGASFDSPFL